MSDADDWPALPVAAWQETYATLHMWMQIVGKIRLALAPMVNHWWQVTFYLTTRGLTTSPMPYGHRTVQIDFDFVDHELRVSTSDDLARRITLAPRTVADFYRDLMSALRLLGIDVKIWTTPVEVETRIPFEQDREHGAYDPEHARRCWRILAQADRVLHDFRSRFIGKCSPVHFFWGSFDLAVTRFSGRPAPAHPGVPGVADYVTREAYSHEVSSCGFWPGGGVVEEPVFYAYAYPEPPGFKDFSVRPTAAIYSGQMKEFILPYKAVREVDNPDEALLAFAQSTYEAAAKLGQWDRASLERSRAGTN